MGKTEVVLSVIGTLLVFAAEGVLLMRDEERGLRALTEVRDQVNQARVELGELEERRDGLRARVQALDRDWDAIAAAAREELGMVLPGEQILFLREGEAGPQRR
jgi:cell division protein FtsB